MDDLTKLPGIGKAMAKKLADAGFSSFTAIAAMTVSDHAKLQEAGFSTADIDRIAPAAQALLEEQANGASNTSQGGPQGGAGDIPAGPAGGDPLEEFPRLIALLTDWREKHSRPPAAIRIVSRVEGFWRGGLKHTVEGVSHPVEAFAETPARLEAILGEPMLVVTLVEATDE